MCNIVIPEGAVNIGRWAFNGCKDLVHVELPESLQSIGNGAFQSCSGLTEMTVPDNVTSIDDDAFRGCTSLMKISLPEGLQHIGNMAFAECSQLPSIILPDSVVSVGYSLFPNCTKLETISVGTNLTSFGDAALRAPHATVKVVRGSEAELYCMLNGIPYMADIKIESLTLATNETDGIIEVYGEEYPRTVNHSKILNLPTALHTIGKKAFVGIEAQQAVVPYGCTTIDSAAFSNSTTLQVIVIPESVAQIAADAFSGSRQVIIVCASGSYAEQYAIENDFRYYTI